jgi:hypothetical protein
MERSPDLLSQTVQELEEIRRALEGVESTTLSGVALILAEAAESLSRTAKALSGMQPTEWMTAEQAAKHLGCQSVDAFEKIAAREGIPKHYLSARAPRYNRGEVDAWLTGRQRATRG